MAEKDRSVARLNQMVAALREMLDEEEAASPRVKTPQPTSPTPQPTSPLQQHSSLSSRGSTKDSPSARSLAWSSGSFLSTALTDVASLRASEGIQSPPGASPTGARQMDGRTGGGGAAGGRGEDRQKSGLEDSNEISDDVASLPFRPSTQSPKTELLDMFRDGLTEGSIKVAQPFSSPAWEASREAPQESRSLRESLQIHKTGDPLSKTVDCRRDSQPELHLLQRFSSLDPPAARKAPQESRSASEPGARQSASLDKGVDTLSRTESIPEKVARLSYAINFRGWSASMRRSVWGLRYDNGVAGHDLPI
ncbi:hypothetical protein T484DRAFT_2305032 [Baffinella frigidus]|nr:hypothetical protein T484DRAFT_2305032 [Cryptophyta sp. CCMP2293]